MTSVKRVKQVHCVHGFMICEELTLLVLKQTQEGAFTYCIDQTEAARNVHSYL